VLVCGTNDPAIEASDSELSLVLAHGTAALRLALRTAHALRANRELAREVGLLQAGIVQTGKLASLGELSASVVHELGNPLTSIMAYCDYLLRRAEGSGAAPDDVERLRRIGEAADRILELTRALISYARPDDAGTCPLDVHQVVDRALVFCEHVVDAAGVSVRRELPEALPPVPGVRSQLIQVFVNLVTNACQAMTPAGGTLTVSARVEIGVEQVLVSFADSGPGIAPEHLPRIFEPFFTTKERGEGTGLGLSIVRCIVEAHGGTIRVESRVGKGTTFLVSLPSAIGPGA
jgi:signal transduction histidine kinase